MSGLRILQVDAFTTRPLAGNPCAVIPDADGLTARTMQAIARELNLSETAFVLPSSDADFRCRYFTPLEEIPLAGHPTIATVHALLELGRIPGDKPSVTLELAAGVIRVDIERDEAPPRIVMTQLPPQWIAGPDAHSAAQALGIADQAIDPALPIAVVSTGTPQLMVPIGDLAALREIAPDAAAVRRLRKAAGFFSLHAFTLETVDASATAHSRHWGLSADGLFEDPVTGSASGGMICHLLRHDAIQAGAHILEQGDALGRPGRVHAEVRFDAQGDVAAPRIGGQAVTVLRGELEI